MTLFACASVAVQHSLALGRRTLLPLVAVAARRRAAAAALDRRAADDLALALVLGPARARASSPSPSRVRAAPRLRQGELTATSRARPTGLARVRELWRLFRNEREDPEPFYSWLADELAADLERRHGAARGPHAWSTSAAAPATTRPRCGRAART